MKESIRLSIIIPHYNRPSMLKKLLDSIIDECDIGRTVEVIVVDDLSTLYIDEYNELCQAYSKKGIVFLSNDTGVKGPGASRNKAIDLATGEWIICADSDDFMIGGWYEKVATYFDSAYDVIFFMPTSIILEAGGVGTRHLRYKKLLDEYVEGKPGAEIRLRYEYNSPWSKMVRKSLVEQNHIRFDLLMHGEDTMFAVKIGYHMGNFDVCQSEIYCITESSASMTNVMTEEAFYLRATVFVRKYTYVKERVTNIDWGYLDWDSNPMKRLYRVFQRKYGMKAMVKYIKLFHSNGIKILNKSGIRFALRGILVYFHKPTIIKK